MNAATELFVFAVQYSAAAEAEAAVAAIWRARRGEGEGWTVQERERDKCNLQAQSRASKIVHSVTFLCMLVLLKKCINCVFYF